MGVLAWASMHLADAGDPWKGSLPSPLPSLSFSPTLFLFPPRQRVNSLTIFCIPCFLPHTETSDYLQKQAEKRMQKTLAEWEAGGGRSNQEEILAGLVMLSEIEVRRLSCHSSSTFSFVLALPPDREARLMLDSLSLPSFFAFLYESRSAVARPTVGTNT
jgi:hypothetical protein